MEQLYHQLTIAYLQARVVVIHRQEEFRSVKNKDLHKYQTQTDNMFVKQLAFALSTSWNIRKKLTDRT